MATAKAKAKSKAKTKATAKTVKSAKTTTKTKAQSPAGDAKGDVVKTLDRALQKLNANDHESALDALLTAWRARRSTRIADVIDRVSEIVAARRGDGGTIKGKTVKERTEKWLETAKAKDAADVGVLLATPWPGTWEHAMPVIEALARFPDDPRIAMALARLVEATPYDTWTSSRFYRVLFAYFNKQHDLRTLPVLEGQLDHVKSSYWKHGTRPMELAAIAKLKAYQDDPKTLSAAEETALAAVEALYAAAATAEKEGAKNAADFLKGIYENPDDDSLRAVFADWLTERGDPRGELISLQLAHAEGRATDASLKREASLLKKHAKDWLGHVLDRYTSKDHRVFERGFLAHATLELDGYPEAPPRELSDPAWSTLRSLTMTWRPLSTKGLAAAILNLPSMKWLRTARSLDENALADLMDGPVRDRWDELDFTVSARAASDSPDDQAELDRTRLLITEKAPSHFPNAKYLSLEGDLERIGWVLETPLAKRAERITVYDSDYLAVGLLEAVNRLKLPVKELWLMSSNRHYGTSWKFIFRRDADGRFTKLHGEPDGASTVPSRYTLDAVLTSLAPKGLTELSVERARVCSYDEDDILTVERSIAAFETLTSVDVPWERLKAAPLPKTTQNAAASGGAAPGAATTSDEGDDGDSDSDSDSAAEPAGEPSVSLMLSGKRFSSQKDVAKLWALAHEAPLSLALDSYAVNHGKHTTLPSLETDEAVTHITGVLEKKRTTSLRLYRKGAGSAASLSIQPYKETRWRRDKDESLSLESAWSEDPGYAEAYLAWLMKLLDAVSVDEGHIPFFESTDVLEPLRYSPHFGWVAILGSEHEKYLDFDGLTKLGGSKGLESLRVLRSKNNAVLVASANPATTPDASWQLAFQVALLNLIWDGYRKRWNTTPREMVLELLGPPLKKAGFTLGPMTPLAEALGHVYFLSRDASGARALYFELTNAMSDMSFTLTKRHAPGNKDADLSEDSDNPRSERVALNNQTWVECNTEVKLRKALTIAASKVATEIMPWFEHPEQDEERKAKRRRR